MIEALGKVSELARQIIALSIGIVTLTMTFAKSFNKSDDPGVIEIPWTLRVSWIFFAISLFFSVLVLMGVIGNINRISKNQKTLIRRGRQITVGHRNSKGAFATNIKGFGYIMLISFTLGFVLVMITGFFHWK